jgi:hypothetical protein
MRSFYYFITITSQIAIALIIGHNDNNIGHFVEGLLMITSHKYQEKKEKAAGF